MKERQRRTENKLNRLPGPQFANRSLNHLRDHFLFSLNKHFSAPAEPFRNSLCNASQHDRIDGSHWVRTVHNNRVDSLFIKLECDGTALALQNTKSSVCHAGQKVLPCETALRVFATLRIHCLEKRQIVASDCNWLYMFIRRNEIMRVFAIDEGADWRLFAAFLVLVIDDFVACLGAQQGVADLPHL